MASSRISSRARSTRRLCLEQLEAREVPSATVFGDASNNWDSALVSTPPSDSYETVDVRLVPHSSGIVVDNANVNFGEGVLIKVSTGTGAGTVLKDDALTSLDDAYNTLHGTAANPLGTDHLNFNFVNRLTGAMAIHLKQLDLGHIAHGNVLIDGSNGRTTVPIPSNGVIPWNPTVGIDSIMLVNVHNQGELNPVGLSGIDVRMYLPDTPVDIGALTTQVAALTQQVSAAQTALTAAEATATPPPALNALPWPEGVNASAKILGKLNVHPGQNLYAMHFSPDGNRFVTAGQDKVAKIWNASTGALERTLTGNNSLVIDAVWSADGQSVWTTGYDKHVRQYSSSTGAVLWDSGDLGTLALSAAMSSDGANLTVSMHGLAPKVINTQTKAVNSLGSGLIWTGNMTAMSDANVLMYVNTNAYRSGNYALIVNPATRQTVWQSNVMGGQLNAIAATPDGQWVIAGDDAGGLAVWKRSTNQQMFTLPNQGGVITSIATSGDGNQLFVGSGSQITAFDLRPLTTNQAPTLLHTYAGIGAGPRGMSVQGKNVTAVSGDNGASRLVAVDRSGLSGYVDPNLGVNTARTQLTALQSSLTSSTAQLQLAQSQEAGHDAIMEIIGRQQAAVGSVEAGDTLEVSAKDRRVEALLDVQTVGGSVRLSSWQGVRTSLPELERSEDGALLFTGSAATLDLATAAHLVTHVSFVVTTSTGHDATIRFLRGDQVIATQTVHSGATVSQADAQGITGVVVLNEEQSLSEQAQDFLTYFNSRDGQFQAGRYAWEWWNQNGYKSFPQFGGAGLAYFAQAAHGTVPDTQKWNILREAASGRHYATLQLADIDVQGNVNQTQAAAPHALEQTPTGLLLNAPDWRQNDDTLRRGASPGYLATGRFSPAAVGIVRDPTKYSVVNLTNVSGGAHPVSVRYHTPGGDTQLAQEYYQILGNSVVLMPGAPSQIVITLHSGDIYQDPGNVDIGHIQSNTLEDILPPEAMSVWTSILAIRNTGPAEGVMNAVTEITDTGRAITPGSGNALVNVWNSGRTGGTVRIITNEGTPQARELSFSLAAQSGKAVSINFTTPANGVLSITTILPDGRRVVDGKTLKLQGDTSEKRVATRQPDGTWTLEWKASTYSGPSVVDGGVMDNNFVLWKQQRIANGDLSVADPANYAKAVMAFAEEMEAAKQIVRMDLESAEGLPNDVYGSGGSPNTSNTAAIWDPRSAAYLADQAMHLYQPNKPVLGIAPAEIQTLQYTAAGRLFLGIAQRAVVAIDDDQHHELENLAAMTSAATGMRYDKVLTYLRASSSAMGRVAALRELFNPSVAEKGDPALRSAFTQPNACGTTVTAVSVSMPDVGTVRLRFNYSTSNFGYDHGNIYLLGPTGSQISNEPLVSGDFRHQLYVDIPLDRIAEILGITGESSDRFLDLRFKVALWEHAGDQTGIGGLNMSGVLSVNLKSRVSDLSTLPAGPQHDLENKILKQLADPAHFAVRNPGQWYWLMGSDHHDGNAYNAVDLNLPAGDEGISVYASANGTVIKAGDDNWHSVIIEHLLPDGTKWYTKYLHMQNLAVHRNGQILALTEGMQILKDDQIGEVGDAGAPGQFHLHFEVIAGSLTGTSIDLRSMLTDSNKGLGMTAKAFDVGQDGSQGDWQDSQLRSVVWDPILKTFATTAVDPTAGVRLIVDRSAQMTAADEAHSVVFWRLEEYTGQPPEQMKKVVWIEKLSDGTIINGWLQADNYLKKWNPVTLQFENR